MTDRCHDLKCWPEPWRQIALGNKPYEVRKADRDYKVGDLLLLREWALGTYTGWAHLVRVTCITDSAPPSPLPKGVVVLGFHPTPMLTFRTVPPNGDQEVLRGQ